MPKWIIDETLWNKAKKIASDEGQSENFAYIMGIYKKMGGAIRKGKK